MKLSEQICQKYPVNLLFAPTQQYDLLLEFDESFSLEERMRIHSVLTRDMNVSMERTGDYPARRCELHKDQRYASLTCQDFQVYFDRDFYLSPLCWVLHALASNAAWAKKCHGKVVTIRLFSAKQQFLALKFKKAVTRQLAGAPSVQTFAQELVRCVKDASERLSGYLPSLCTRPITESGWELICQRNSLKSRILGGRSADRTWQLKELAAELFGEMDVEKELDAWIRFTKGLPDFDREIQRSKKKIKNILLYSCQLADIDNAIAKAKDILYNDDELTADSVQQDIDEVRDSLECTRNVDRFRAEDLPGYFADASSKYEYAAKRILRKEIANLLLEKAGPDINEERKDATLELQRVERDLNRFCPMVSSGTEANLDLSWRQFSQIDDSLLFIDLDSWDGSSFGDLSMNVSTEGLAAWLLCEELCARAEIQNTHGGPYLYPVGVKDRGFAAAVFATAP